MSSFTKKKNCKIMFFRFQRTFKIYKRCKPMLKCTYKELEEEM